MCRLTFNNTSWKGHLSRAELNARQVVFFVPYLSMASDGARSTDDLFSFGKVIFLGIIGAVSLEVPRPLAC